MQNDYQLLSTTLFIYSVLETNTNKLTVSTSTTSASPSGIIQFNSAAACQPCQNLAKIKWLYLLRVVPETQSRELIGWQTAGQKARRNRMGQRENGLMFLEIWSVKRVAPHQWQGMVMVYAYIGLHILSKWSDAFYLLADTLINLALAYLH